MEKTIKKDVEAMNLTMEMILNQTEGEKNYFIGLAIGLCPTNLLSVLCLRAHSPGWWLGTGPSASPAEHRKFVFFYFLIFHFFKIVLFLY